MAPAGEGHRSVKELIRVGSVVSWARTGRDVRLVVRLPDEATAAALAAEMQEAHEQHCLSVEVVTGATTGVHTCPATLFTVSLTDDRYWLDRLGPLGFHRAVHGPFRSLEAAWARANELNRANLGLPDA